jgi:hypothetical protein
MKYITPLIALLLLLLTNPSYGQLPLLPPYGKLPFLPPVEIRPTAVKTNEAPQIKIGKKEVRNLVRKTGTSAYFEIVATPPKKSKGKLSYQWYRNNTPVIGATNKSITITNIQQKQDQGIYSVAVSAELSSTNTVFTLTVIDTNVLLNCYTTTNTVKLEWCPSPDTNVTGYVVKYGMGNITNWMPSIFDTNNPCGNPISVGSNWLGNYTVNLDVGNNTNATVNSLTTDITYYFAVVAYTGLTNEVESLPSNEVMCKVPFKFTDPVLSIMLLTDGTPQVMSKVCPFMPYSMLWTSNFISWNSLVTTNADDWGNIIVPDNDPNRGPMRFYRLRLN